MTIYADAIAALVALSSFLLFFYGPWQGIVVDIARQLAFEQRDAVFDLAVHGKLDFDSPEYKIIRDSFNQLIRFAHELNWVRVAFHWDESKTISDVQTAIEKIEDQETRLKVLTHLRKARFAMLAMLGCKSLPLLVGATIAGVVTWCMGTTRDLFIKIDSVFGEKIQVEAEGA
jgi:hypothetical protein